MNKIISFEGIDGVGKTSHVNGLAQFLNESGYSCIVTRELYGDHLFSQIKGLLMDTRLDGYDELLLVSVARRVHYREVIKPALEEGKIVLLDRFIESTWAYQGGGRKVPASILQFFSDHIWQVPKPDLIVYLTGTPHRHTKQDRFEEESVEFFNAIVSAYQQRQDESWKVFYTDTKFDVIQSMIRDEVMHFLKRTL